MGNAGGEKYRVQNKKIRDDRYECNGPEDRTQWGKNDDSDPVEKYYPARVEFQGKVVEPDDGGEAAEVPAIQGGKGMNPQQPSIFFTGIAWSKFNKDIENAGDCCDDQKGDAR